METNTMFRTSFAVASWLMAVWAVQPAFAAGVPPAPTNGRDRTCTLWSAPSSSSPWAHAHHQVDRPLDNPRRGSRL